MAAIDISILDSVSVVIVFMLVFVGSWGMLLVVDPFKNAGKSFYGILSFFLAVMVVLSRSAMNVILFATPWLILLGFIGFFFLFFARMLSGNSSLSLPVGDAKVYGWIIALVAIIMIFAIGNSFGQDLLSAQVPNDVDQVTVNENGTIVAAAPGGDAYSGVASSDFGRNLTLTLFHPKILGVLFMFILGTMAILLLQ